MKVVLLSAGYATRLYPLTIDTPKPLLHVAGKPVIEYSIGLISQMDEVDEIFVVTNHKFFGHFTEWKKKISCLKKITIVDDGTVSNEDRLGATGDIDFVIKRHYIADDLLVVAGDNIFKSGLNGFVDFAVSKQPLITIGLYDVNDLEQAKQYGIVTLGPEQKVMEFMEKPKKPSSTLAAQCLYFFPGGKLGIIREYLRTSGSKDAPGYFLEWLSKKEDVFGYVFKDGMWFDIGDKKSLEEANRVFKKKRR